MKGILVKFKGSQSTVDIESLHTHVKILTIKVYILTITVFFFSIFFPLKCFYLY